MSEFTKWKVLFRLTPLSKWQPAYKELFEKDIAMIKAEEFEKNWDTPLYKNESLVVIIVPYM